MKWRESRELDTYFGTLKLRVDFSACAFVVLVILSVLFRRVVLLLVLLIDAPGMFLDSSPGFG